MGKPMTSAERKRKSCENKLLKMSENKKLEFTEKERERSRKAMQAKRWKEWENMTPQEIHDFKEKEAARIRALRNKKRTANEQTNKEKAKALLQIASKKRKNPYKSRQRISKALNKVRAAAVVQGIASEYGYQFRSHEENTIPKANWE